MVATAVRLLLQVPPDVVSERVIVDPSQTTVVPVMAAGNGLTVMAFDLKQPVARV